MARIYNYIPEKYWEAFIRHGFHLKSAVEFSDKLEVRYGSIHDFYLKSGLEWPDAVEAAFRNKQLSKCLASALVSCWTIESMPRECMWCIYGHSGPAVRVGVDIDKLKSIFRCETIAFDSYGAMGEVHYGRRQRSYVRPMACQPEYCGSIQNLSWKNKAEFNTYLTDLFLKHDYYAFEKEYRLTRSASTAGHSEWIEAHGSVVEIQFSPIKSCDAEAWVERFRCQFPEANIIS